LLNFSTETIEQLKLEIKEKDLIIEKLASGSLRLKAKLGKYEKEICKFIVEKVMDDHVSTAHV
jgi:hypothetical protein